MRGDSRIAPLVMGLVLALSVVSGVGLGVGSVGAATSTDSTAMSSSAPPTGAANSTHLVYDGEALTVQAASAQVIRGRTNLSAGTRLGIRILSSGGSKTFIKSSGATVTANGSFRTTFDFEDIPAGESMRVSVVYNGTELATANGTVVECTDDCAAPSPASPSATLTTGDDNLTLGAGPGRAIAGVTNLPPGATVTVRLTETSGSSPAVSANRSVIVGSDNRFRAVFNLTDVPAGTPVRASVSHDGSRLTSASGTVVACQAECTPPTASRSDQESTKERNHSEYDDLSTVTVTQGETARVELTFEPETVTLTIGGPQMSYALNASVRDGNDDDRVVVLFATDKIGQSDAVVTAANDSDSASVIDERVDGDRTVLDEGEYFLEQSVGPTTTRPDDDPESFVVERGSLTVADASMDESGSEPAVTDFGWPEIRRNGEYVTQKDVHVRTDGTVRVPITTDEMHATTVTVGSPFAPYFLSADVRDGTGDERVVLVFNATAAHENSSTPPLHAADDGDSVTVTHRNGTLTPGEYDTDLYLGRVDVTADWENSSKRHVVFGMGGRLIVAEGNSTPTMSADTTVATDSAVTFGILGLGSVLGALGIAFLVGLVEL